MRARLFLLDETEPHRLAALGPPFDPSHENTLTLDITDVPPHAAAEMILEPAEAMSLPSADR